MKVAGKKGDVPGTWSFSGWDPTGEITVEGNTTIKGSWTFETEKYTVKYDWGTDAPAGETLPTGAENVPHGSKYTCLLYTSTMVGNYTKEGLLKKIKGKKYPREHLLMMVLLYHLKRSLTLGDIKSLFGMVEEDLTLDRNRCV